MVKIFKRLAILFVVLSFILPGYDVYCTLAKDDDSYREYLIKNGINGNLDDTPTNYAPKILTNPLIKDYINHFNNSAFDGNKLVKMPHEGTDIKNSGYWYKPAENIVVQEGNRKQFLFIARVNKDATTRDSVITYEAWSHSKELKTTSMCTCWHTRIVRAITLNFILQKRLLAVVLLNRNILVVVMHRVILELKQQYLCLSFLMVIRIIQK